MFGGDGNDTLTGGKGSDTFVFSSGYDIITDYTKKDTIKIDSEAGGITNVKARGNNVVFEFEDGSLTVKNGKNKTITLVNEDGDEVTEKFTMSNIRDAEDILTDFWFESDDEDFDDEDDDQIGSILADNENYSSIGNLNRFNPISKGNNFFGGGNFQVSINFNFGSNRHDSHGGHNGHNH